MALLQTHSFYRCHLTGFYTGAEIEMFGLDNIWLVIDTQVALTDFFLKKNSKMADSNRQFSKKKL